jgi:aquaporin Z
LVFGLVVMAVVRAAGAHANPAVTLALWREGLVDGRRAVVYVGAQLSGAVLASLLLSLLFPATRTLGQTIPAGSLFQSFVLEMLMTFFLMLVILRAKGEGAAAAIGAVVAVEAIMGGPVSGASMNPARSFGPALVSGVWTAHWLYWLAPCAGALLAGALSTSRRAG